MEVGIIVCRNNNFIEVDIIVYVNINNKMIKDHIIIMVEYFDNK